MICITLRQIDKCRLFKSYPLLLDVVLNGPRITKTAFDYKRRKGRPRLKWIDDVQKYLEHAGITNCK